MKVVRKIMRTPLIRVTSLNSVSVIIKILIGIITSKVIANFIGAPGLALVGNFRNFITASESIVTLGFTNGIVKYVSQHSNDKTYFKKFLATSFITLFTAAALFSVVMFFFAGYWNDVVFGAAFNYKLVFQISAIALPWYGISLFLIAVINGLGRFRNVIKINIYGNIIGLVITVLMIWQYQTFGALLSIVLAPSLLFFVSFYFINREMKFANYISLAYFDFTIIKNLSSYSLMAFVSAVLGPLVFLSIRKYLILEIGIESAGFWEAMNRISAYYLMFISTIISVYYLPKLSLATTNEQSKKVFYNYFKSIIPLFVAGLFVIYLLRSFIVELLFNEDLSPVTDLFFWQLLGDVFKAASMILGFQFFAARMTKAFIITELLSLLILYVSSIMLIDLMGSKGVVMAHALTYFIYLIVLLIYFRKKL